MVSGLHIQYRTCSNLAPAPPEVEHKPNDIEKTLNAIGVHYTHRNDDLIAESAIEGQRMQLMLQVRILWPAHSVPLIGVSGAEEESQGGQRTPRV